MTLQFRNYSDLVRDTLKLAPLLRDVDAIVGVPRSGMFPASVLATHLNKPLAQLGDNGEVALSSGARLDYELKRWNCALVDDSVLTGAAMKVAGAIIAGFHPTRACVYLAPGAARHVDAYAMVLPTPRLFEWNLFNSFAMPEALLDIDGVLCPDPPMMEDDTDAYEHYIAHAPPLYLPGRKVKGIVTNRLEKYREVTEAWLASHGVEHGGLQMAPFKTPQARRRMSSPAMLKAAWYGGSGAGLLVESHDQIASEVAGMTNQAVISVESMRCFQ